MAELVPLYDRQLAEGENRHIITVSFFLEVWCASLIQAAQNAYGYLDFTLACSLPLATHRAKIFPGPQATNGTIPGR